jgi:hypothetical protein
MLLTSKCPTWRPSVKDRQRHDMSVTRQVTYSTYLSTNRAAGSRWSSRCTRLTAGRVVYTPSCSWLQQTKRSRPWHSLLWNSPYLFHNTVSYETPCIFPWHSLLWDTLYFFMTVSYETPCIFSMTESLMKHLVSFPWLSLVKHPVYFPWQSLMKHSVSFPWHSLLWSTLYLFHGSLLWNNLYLFHGTVSYETPCISSMTQSLTKHPVSFCLHWLPGRSPFSAGPLPFRQLSGFVI